MPNEEPTQPKGRGWHGNSEGHRKAGQLGGQQVSKNRKHMSEIGRLGGMKVAKKPGHMRAIALRPRKKESTDQLSFDPEIVGG